MRGRSIKLTFWAVRVQGGADKDELKFEFKSKGGKVNIA